MSRRASISRALAAGLFLAVALIDGAVVGCVYLLQASRAVQRDLAARGAIADMSLSLSQPLWDLDLAQLRRVSAVIAHQECVAGLAVRDADDALLLEVGSLSGPREERILRDQARPIGRVELAFDPGGIERELSRLRTACAIALVGSLVIVLAVTGLLLNLLLRRPLEQLERALERAEEGDYEGLGQEIRPSELAGIATRFDRLGAALRAREEDLRVSERSYREIFDGSEDVLLVLDPETGEIVDANLAVERVFGQPRAAVLGRGLDELLREGEADEEDDQRAGRLLPYVRGARQEPRTFLTRGRGGSGEPLVGELALRSARIGETERVLAALRDVSARHQAERERAELEEQLRQSQKIEALGQLVGGVAHDFNNLLQVIRSANELATRSPDFPAAKQHLEASQEAVLRAADLVAKLLAFSRRSPLEAELHDLNALVAELLDLLRRVIGPGVELAFEPCPAALPVRVDRRAIEQVLTNLCLNARDAMPEAGRIEIRCELIEASEDAESSLALAGRRARLRVRDEGVGMDEATRRRMLEPFFTTKGEGKGTGLGLSVVYGILRAHGGALEVETQVARGTTVDVLLPLVAEAPSEAQPAPGAAAPAAGGGERILLAEDRPLVRRLLARQLRDAGYRVVEVADGLEAVERFPSEEPDLILSDVLMPRLTGFEAYAEIHALDPSVPVVFMSGNDQEPPPPGCPLLRKPIERELLLRTVREALARER